MRVLVTIFEQLVPISGGGTPRIRAIIAALVEKGHEVSVAASFSVEAKTALQILQCNEVIPLKNVSRLDKDKIKKYLLFHPYNIGKIICKAKKEKPDLMIAHNSIAGLAQLWTKKFPHRTQTHLVLDMTDLIFEYLPYYRGDVSWASSLLALGRKLENKVIRETDKIITISKAMRDVLIQKGAEKRNIEIVSDGVKLDLFRPLGAAATNLRQAYAPGARNVVMHHGVLDPQDRPEILVDAARIVLKKHPQTVFWLIGDGAAVPYMKKKARMYGVSGNFFFSGWVPFQEVPKFISACDVGLVILPNSLSARIRVTLKGFEYWACKKPIIVPKLPALKEIVTHRESGLFYEPENPEDLADKICILLEDKHLSKNIGEIGRGLAEERYSWSRLASQFVSKCEGMLKSHSAIGNLG